MRAFLDGIGVRDQPIVVGHSFGGGVATRLAHDHPGRVRALVLVNSVGGGFSPAAFAGTMLRSPIPRFDWRLGMRMFDSMRADVVDNVLHHSVNLAQVAVLARTVDLTTELAELRRRGLPVQVLTTSADAVIPRRSFDAICAAIGAERTVVDGGHSWLLGNPRGFSDALAHLVGSDGADDDAARATAAADQLLSHLHGLSVPSAEAQQFLAAASPLWLTSDSPRVLAADLALCLDRLGRNEVRAVARPTADRRTHRLTVVTADRPGLLAATAAAVAAGGLTVQSAAASTWKDRGLALHSLTVRSNRTVDWAALGVRLRDRAAPEAGAAFRATGRARVLAATRGRGAVIKVTAPDTSGLLQTITGWLAERRVSIRAAHVTTSSRTALDTFLVDGRFDPDELADRLNH